MKNNGNNPQEVKQKEQFLEQHLCKLSEDLKDIISPLWDRMDQLLETTDRMLHLLEQKQLDDSADLKNRLIDNHDLKEILKVGNTNFFEKKSLFKTYNIGKDYYLQDEVLAVIKRHEVKVDKIAQNGNIKSRKSPT